MAFGGLATVAAQLLMGARSTAWAWSITPVAMVGAPAVVFLAHVPASVAVFSLFIQGGTLLAVGIPALRAVRHAGDGGHVGVLILNWRDMNHPQGGGSEVYVEQVARRLAAAGRDVTIFCSAYPGAPATEVVHGVRFIRKGGWRTVYLWAFLYHLFGRFGQHDVVVDVKNGIPFLAPAYCRRPVLCLVHHVHREQWTMNFSNGWARFGWWIESRLSPRVYRRSRHVAVSEASRRELIAAFGIRAADIDVVYNGGEPASRQIAVAPSPTILTLGRLVPHKRVEIVLEAAAQIRSDVPGLAVVVAGQGSWQPELSALAARLGIADAVTFTGWVDEQQKERLLDAAWVLGMPSLKEGWGLAVMEAAAHGTPAVAFRVGGLEESIGDGETGLLVEDVEGFASALRRLLLDAELRCRMGAEAARRAGTYSWERTAAGFDAVIRSVLAPQVVIDVASESVIEAVSANSPRLLPDSS
jgi:glycosyltransferase involved in cell wall biosynthesis